MTEKHSFIVSILLVFMLCLSKQGYAAPLTIDPNNLDPYLWQKMQNELREKEKTRKIVGYYFLGKEKLELKETLELSDTSPHEGFELMSAINGEKYFVSNEAAMDSNDIYGISLEMTNYKGVEEYTFILYFKQESWDKFYELTKRLIRKNLAMVRGQAFLSAPRIMSPLRGSAQIAGLDKAQAEKFKTGLTPVDRAEIDAWNKKSLEWLENRSKKNPDDIEILSMLARNYYEEQPRECEKALPLFEKIIHLSRSQLNLLYPVHACFKLLKQYDNAVNFYYQTLSFSSDKMQEMEIRLMITEMYGLAGKDEQMIDEAEKVLAITKETPLPTFNFPTKGPEWDKFFKEMREAKEQAIKKQEAFIENAKRQLDEKRTRSR